MHNKKPEPSAIRKLHTFALPQRERGRPARPHASFQKNVDGQLAISTTPAHLSSYRLFTLVELLVVVAVISLLMALLLPALSKTKDSAKGISCVNNLKQIILQANCYANDYNGYIPIPHDGVSGWHIVLVNGGYLRLDGSLRCPSYNPRDLRISTNIFYIYGMPDPQGPYRLHNLDKPSSRWYYADSISTSSKEQYYILYRDNPALSTKAHCRHSRKTNMAFADGHASPVGVDEFMVLDKPCLNYTY